MPKQDLLDAPTLPERFTSTIVNAIAAGAAKVEVFLVGKKLKILITWP